MTRQPGRALQDIVAALERLVSTTEGVTIESPKRILDKDTGQLREHDIVITRRDAHHVILTAIECKDLGRKVGVPAVEAFSKKCEKTGIHHRVIASGSGFTRTAKRKADALDIGCIELSEATEFDWLELNRFVSVEREIHHVHADLFFHNEWKPVEPFTIFDCNDYEVSGSSHHLQELAERILQIPAGAEPPVGKSVRLGRVENPGWRALGADGLSAPVDWVGLEVTASFRQSEGEMQLHSYRADSVTYGIASTDLRIGDADGKILLIDDGNGVRIGWSRVDSLARKAMPPVEVDPELFKRRRGSRKRT